MRLQKQKLFQAVYGFSLTPCFVSLEKKMACGIGACLGCTCETRSGEGKSVCKNGPVFDAAEVF